MIPIVMYARSDVCSIAIPVSSGGCGAQHTRTVTRGVPDKVFSIDCPPCESYLSGARKPRILRHKIENGRVVSQERVADADPHWSSTPETVPLTPDEDRVNKTRSERGAQQIQMIQALAALRASGVELPSDALWLLERELPPGVLKGTVVCANGHDVPAGLKFCGECGVSMAARAAISGSGDGAGELATDLGRLHPQTLKKLCRERDLPDTGSKDELIQRLAA